jgi:hypothetical protein
MQSLAQTVASPRNISSASAIIGENTCIGTWHLFLHTCVDLIARENVAREYGPLVPERIEDRTLNSGSLMIGN